MTRFFTRGKYLMLQHRLVGDPQQFSFENRAFNAVCLFSLLVIAILFPFNVYLRLYPIVILLSALLLLTGAVYYLSRFRQRFAASVIAYGIGSYASIGFVYFVNEGINGPAMLLFFLTFALLVGFTQKHLHRYWIAFHLAIPALLLVTEFLVPAWVPRVYENRLFRFVDIGSSYLFTLVFTYLIIVYLRKGYLKEKETALQHTRTLERINQEKNKLFSIVAHDLQSPLHTLQAYLELLNEDYRLAPEERKSMEAQLLQATRSTSDLLTNLLVWAKTQMEGSEVKMETLNLAETLQPVLQSVMPMANAKSLKLSFNIHDSVTVEADRHMLQLVIRNLLNNAIKFTPPQGSISLSSDLVNGSCRIQVIDNGKGIPEAQQSSLFSLNTVPSYGTGNEKGFGLGLLLSRDYIEKQNGRIGFHSVEGKGSRFYVELQQPAPLPAS